MNKDNILAARKDKTIYLDEDKVYKVFNENYSKVGVLQEAINQAKVEETGLNIPKILGVTMLEGKWTIVSEYIKGKTIADLMEENPAEKEYYLDMFVNVQMDIHAKACSGIVRFKDKLREALNAAEISDTTRYDLQARLESTPKHYKLCHGDLDPSNIIISDDGNAYIIDWYFASLGNTSADVATSYLKFCLKGERELGDKYLKLYCEKSGTEIKFIQKWMPIVAAARSTKNISSEKELLSSWIDVVEYV